MYRPVVLYLLVDRNRLEGFYMTYGAVDRAGFCYQQEFFILRSSIQSALVYFNLPGRTKKGYRKAGLFPSIIIFS
jgi:hypothetical protein